MSWLFDLIKRLFGRRKPQATVEETVSLLSLCVVTGPRWDDCDWEEIWEEAEGWTPQEREYACQWAAAEHLGASDNGVERLARPLFFPKHWR